MKKAFLNTKINFHSIAIFLLAIGFFVFSHQGLISKAQENTEIPEQGTTLITPIQGRCYQDLELYIQDRKIEFNDFLKDHFANNSANDDLIEVAVLKYEAFRRDINQKKEELFLAEIQKTENSKNLDFISYSEAKCDDIITDNLNETYTVMRTLAVENSNLKTTDFLIDSYKHMNEKLEVLNEDFIRFQASFDDFKDKVIFTEQCIQN